MKNESRKILNLPELQVSCTCVRVPVYRLIQFRLMQFQSRVNMPDARDALMQFQGLDFVDSPEKISTYCPSIARKLRTARSAASE